MGTGTLVLEDIAKNYESPTSPLMILDGISLTIPAGETVVITGPSGSGKSTLLNLIGSLDLPTSGNIRLGEIMVNGLTGKALEQYRSSHVGFVFQEHHLLPQLTALENVLLPTLVSKRRGAADEAGDLLNRVGVGDRAAAFPTQMSGGERQRVAIARALINHPSILLCDEPTGNLDQASGSTVISLLLELAEQQGVTVIMVTHNAAHASRFARCLQLHNGHLEAVEELR